MYGKVSEGRQAVFILKVIPNQPLLTPLSDNYLSRKTLQNVSQA